MRNWSENQITLVFIRHGTTQSNEERRYLGKTEERLSSKGREELFLGKEQHRYPKADFVFSSPMERCLETARLLYLERQPVVIPEWEEMDFGAFEGKNYLDLQGDTRYQAWIDSGGTLPFPEGESREAFIRRCDAGFRNMFEQLLQLTAGEHKKAVTVAMIVHGGTIMSLLSRYSGGEYFDYQVPNGGGYLCRLEYVNGTIQIPEPKRFSVD